MPLFPPSFLKTGVPTCLEHTNSAGLFPSLVGASPHFSPLCVVSGSWTHFLMPAWQTFFPRWTHLPRPWIAHFPPTGIAIFFCIWVTWGRFQLQRSPEAPRSHSSITRRCQKWRWQANSVSQSQDWHSTGHPVSHEHSRIRDPQTSPPASSHAQMGSSTLGHLMKRLGCVTECLRHTCRISKSWGCFVIYVEP